MLTMIRRMRPRPTAQVTFCESRGQVCTPTCRANAQFDRSRTAALGLLPR